MRKSSISFVLFIMMIVPCFILMAFNLHFDFSQAEEISFEEFEKQVIKAFDNEDITYIEVDKDSSLADLKKTLDIESDDFPSKNLLGGDLSPNQIKNICKQNDYVVTEEKDCFKVRNRYSLKRIIVNGEVENTYNASKHITGYKDYNFLCYDTIEQTKYAYQRLINNDQLNVCLDAVISCEEETIVKGDYDYSRYNSWGAEAMGVEVYNQYLNINGVSNEAVVVVIDTGINTAHEIFQDRILKDSNGELVGYSYYSTQYTYSGYDFEDDKGHGSHVSGTIVELTPSNVKILPIKALNYQGKGFVSYCVMALERINEIYAQEYNIICDNMSLGAEMESQTSIDYWKATYDNILKPLKEKRILSVVAAGNDAGDTINHSPAHCEENAITVSALKRTNDGYAFDSGYSNFGTAVDIAAPGTHIASAYINSENAPGSRYVLASGTSMATPHVSAAVVLLALDKVYYTNGLPTYTTDDIEKRLYNSAIDMGDVGKDIYYGNGMLSLANYNIPITYEASGCEVTYDGQYHNITVNVLNIEDYTITYGLTKDVFDITDITKNDAFKNATKGVMPVYFKISTELFSTVGVEYLQINQYPITAMISDQTFTYGEVKFDKNKFTLSSSVLTGDVVNFSLTTMATNTSPVGTYDIKISCDNDNYIVSSENGKLTINQRPIAIKLSPQNFLYGEQINLDTSKYFISSGKIVNNDKLGLNLKTSAKNRSDVGEYKVEVDSYSNNNYVLTWEASKLTISPRPVSISLNAQSSMYGEDISIDKSLYTITSGSILQGDELDLDLSTNANKKSIGDYTLFFNGCANKNYNLTASNGIYKVTKRQVKVKCNNQSMTYGEVFAFNNNDYQILSGSILAEDAINVTLQTNATSTSEVGDYDIFVNLANPNYDFTVTNAKLSILPRILNVSIEKQKITYGESFNIEELDYSLISGSIINNDNVEISFSTLATQFSGAGEYEIKGVSSNKNYTIQIDNCVLTIEKRPIVIEKSQSSVYGNAVNCDNTYTLVEGDIVNNDNLNLRFRTTATSRSNVGEYEISIVNANYNYQIKLQNGIYEVTPRNLSVTLTYQDGVYGDAPILNQKAYSVSGLVAGDDPKISIFTNATSKSDIGVYELNAICGNKNYNADIKGASYRVVRRQLLIRLHDQVMGYSFSLKYDNDAYEIISGSIVNGDDINLVIESNAKSYALSGEYVLTATSNNNNYEVRVIEGQLVVRFSEISLLVVVVPIILFTAGVVALYLLRRKHNRNKYLVED